MNIKKLLDEVDRAIKQITKEGLAEKDDSKRTYIGGIIGGLKLLPDIINEVNLAAWKEVNPRYKCNGYASRKGICTNIIPRKFLYSYCEECMDLRRRFRGYVKKVEDTENIEDTDEVCVIPMYVKEEKETETDQITVETK